MSHAISLFIAKKEVFLAAARSVPVMQYSMQMNGLIESSDGYCTLVAGPWIKRQCNGRIFGRASILVLGFLLVLKMMFFVKFIIEYLKLPLI